MSWTIIAHPDVDKWLATLDSGTSEQVTAALDLLADEGPGLRRPLADRIRGSRHHNMKELRPGSAGTTEIRILFAFDPVRRAILLADDKSKDWAAWYRQMIPIADNRLDDHLQKVQKQEKEKGNQEWPSGARGKKSAPKQKRPGGSAKRR